MKKKKIVRFAIVISIATLFLSGTNPIQVEGNLQAISETHNCYLPLIMKSYQHGTVTVTYRTCWFRDPWLYLQGTIHNNTDKTIYNVRVNAEVFDNGVHVRTIEGTSIMPAIFPFDDMPVAFGVPHPLEFQLSDYHEVFVSVDSYDYESDPEYLSLTILSKNFSGFAVQSELTGEIRNDNLETIEDIKALVNGTADCGGFSRVDIITSTLVSGETTAYSAEIYYPVFDDGEDFTIWVQGAIAP